MRDQSARDAAFSMACARCSGRILQLASFCPHCGARLALAGGAPIASHEHGGSSVPAARFEPPMRSFAPADFEGDLDAPPDGFPDSPGPPEVKPHPLTRARALLGPGWREWGVKSRVGLILASCAVVFGGFAALHRYDGPSVAPAVEEGASKSIDDSPVSNKTVTSKPGGLANDAPRPSAAPEQGVLGAAPDTVTPRVADAGTAKTPPRAGGAAKGKHGARSSGHARSHTHGHRRAKKWTGPWPDLYLHSDVLPHRRFGQNETMAASSSSDVRAFAMI